MHVWKVLEFHVMNAGMVEFAEVVTMGLGRKGKEMRSFMRVMQAFEVTKCWTYRKTGRVNVRFYF